MYVYEQSAASKPFPVPTEAILKLPPIGVTHATGGSCAAITLYSLGGFATAMEAEKLKPGAKLYSISAYTDAYGKTTPEKLGTFKEWIEGNFRRVFRLSSGPGPHNKNGDPEWVKRVKSYSVVTWIASNEYTNNIADGDALRDFFLENGFVVHTVDGGFNPNHYMNLSRNIRYYAAFPQVNANGNLDPYDVSTITTIRIKDLGKPNPELVPHVPESAIDGGAGRTGRGTLKSVSPKIRRVAAG